MEDANFSQLFFCYLDSFIYPTISVSSCYADRIIDWENREHRERHEQAGREKQMDKKGEEGESKQVERWIWTEKGKHEEWGGQWMKECADKHSFTYLTVYAGKDWNDTERWGAEQMNFTVVNIYI